MLSQMKMVSNSDSEKNVKPRISEEISTTEEVKSKVEFEEQEDFDGIIQNGIKILGNLQDKSKPNVELKELEEDFDRIIQNGMGDFEQWQNESKPKVELDVKEEDFAEYVQNEMEFPSPFPNISIMENSQNKSKPKVEFDGKKEDFGENIQNAKVVEPEKTPVAGVTRQRQVPGATPGIQPYPGPPPQSAPMPPGAAGLGGNGSRSSSFQSTQMLQLRAQIMAYRFLARNQPLPPQIAVAVTGRRPEQQQPGGPPLPGQPGYGSGSPMGPPNAQAVPGIANAGSPRPPPAASGQQGQQQGQQGPQQQHGQPGMKAGQGIPTGQAGHLLVKTETGQYKIVKVSPNAGKSKDVATSRTSVVSTAVSSPHTSAPAGGSPAPKPGGGMGGGQVTLDALKIKCKNFLATLQRLANEQPPAVAKNVRHLIQGLVDGIVDPQTFAIKLQRELNSSPQPCLAPFLKRSLPFLQNSLASGELTIDGVRRPRFTEKRKLQVSLNECREQRDMFLKDLESQRQVLNENQKKLVAIDEEKRKLQMSLNECREQKDMFFKDIESQWQVLNENQKKLVATDEEKRKLQMSLNECREQKDMFLKDLESQRQVLNENQKKLVANDEEKRKLHFNLNECRELLHNALKENWQLESQRNEQIQASSTMLKISRQTNKELREKLEERETLINKLQSQLLKRKSTPPPPPTEPIKKKRVDDYTDDMDETVQDNSATET